MTVDPDRAAGCLLGLAVGDALGTTLEFRRPGSFEPITDMSRTTHGARTCVDACRYATRLMILLLRGDDKDTALEKAAGTDVGTRK